MRVADISQRQPSRFSHTPLAEAPPRAARRVAYLAHYTAGGSANSLQTLVEALDHTKYEPFILCHSLRDLAWAGALEAQGVPVVGLLPPGPAPRTGGLKMAGRLGASARLGPFGRVYRTSRAVESLLRHDRRWQRALARELRQRRPALVHCNNGLRAHRLDILLCRLLGLPTICHVRNFELLTDVERLAARFVWRFVYISRAVAAAFEQQGIPAHQGLVIPNALAAGALDAPRPLPRSDLGCEPEHFVVANVGRLVRWKGQAVFLHAIARLAPERPNLRALIVGQADDNEGSRAYAAELRALVVSLGLSGRVIFTGHRTDVQRVMATADVVAHTAVTPEPFGRVLIEAMATGRPIVATGAGGVLDILEHERTGLLVPPNDSEALACSLLRLECEPGLRARLGAAGRLEASRNYSAAEHAKQVSGLYHLALAESAQRTAVA